MLIKCSESKAKRLEKYKDQLKWK